MLELASAKEVKEIILVTGNTSDFGPHGGLAPDLIDDLDKLNIPTASVKICDGLHNFIETHVKPKLSKLDNFQTAIQEQSFVLFNVEDFFADAFHDISAAVKDHVRHWGFEELGYFSRRMFEVPRLLGINESFDEYEVAEVYRTNEEEVAFSITFKIPGTIECDEIYDCDPRERPWTTEFFGEAIFSVETSQVMEESTGQITEFTVDSVKIAPDIGWPFDEID